MTSCALAADGLVAWHPQSRGRGRPTHVYRLTRAAEPLFPKTYGGLTNELLSYVGEADPSLVDGIFDRRRQRRLEGAQARLAAVGPDFATRVAEVARILDEDGYLASFEAMPDGTYRIVEHNCAVLDVAERYGQACSSEIAFLQDALPDAVIERTHHMMAGAHMCCYQVRPESVALCIPEDLQQMYGLALHPAKPSPARPGRFLPFDQFA